MNNQDNTFGISDPIAVIGLACRFPKAPNAEIFWHNLIHGISGQSYFSQEELRAAGISDQITQQDNFVPGGAVIDNPEYFDAGLFGYSQNEALSIDPQQRLFLQIVWHALEDAGYTPTDIKTKTGVFGSIRSSTYPAFTNFDVTQVGKVKGLQALVGNDKDYLATRVAHKFNLTGPALTIQTACSSSLVAAHVACESLRAGECDMAIAGGVAVSFPQSSGYQYQPGMIFSPDGLCRPFDAGANGTFGGNGLGCVVLKRLDDALHDGDTILAVLRGSAINNDGQHKVSFTAPSVNGQAKVLSDALHLADVMPDDVEMIETHGTGTKLGDPIEISAIKQAYQRSTNANPCFLGSVKSGLGHLDTAAGIASLIKTVLSVSQGKIPLSLNITQPNPALELEGSGFKLATESIDWQSSFRTAAVSSFGIGGTNCHMIVQSAPKLTAPEQTITPPDTAKLLISANSETSLRRLAGEYATLLEKNDHYSDIAYSALSGRALDLPYRLAINCDLTAVNALRHFAKSGQISSHLRIGQHSEKNKIVWCFTGQGSQWAGMGQELYETSSAFRQSIELSQSYAHSVSTIPLTEYLFGNSTELLTRTDYAQLAIVAFEIAMAAHWQSKGFEPDMVMGHSVGEFAACVIAGYLTHEQAILLVAERGKMMHLCAKKQAGAMLAVFAEQFTLNSLSALRSLDLAAHNGKQHWVYSGLVTDVDLAISELDAQGIRYRKLDVPCAAHSRLLDEMLPSFSKFATSIQASQGQITLISSLTGQLIDNAASLNAHYWTRHVREPVQFRRAIESALNQNAYIFFEMGPNAHLTAIGQRENWAQSSLWISTCKPDMPTKIAEADALASLFVTGIDKDWPKLFNLSGRRCKLPHYAFDEQKYWYQPPVKQHTETGLSTPIVEVEKPAALSATYEMLRCCAIRDFIHSCTTRSDFTLRDIIRGGRLLPRYRHLITALLNTLIEHGYVQKQNNNFKYDTGSLPATEIVAQWVRDTLLANEEDTELKLTDVRALCEAAPDIRHKLSSYEAIPEQAGKYVEDIEYLLLNQRTTASTPDLTSTLPNNSQLLYLDWSVLQSERDWNAVISRHLSRFVHEKRNDWLISVTDTIQPNGITQLVVHRIAQMWGQVKYSLRGRSTAGHWVRVGEVKTPDFNELSELTLQPSPHNRYHWQWHSVEANSQALMVNNSDIERAFLTKGKLCRVNSAISLLALPDAPLTDSAAQVINAVMGEFETLYVLTSKTIPAYNMESIEPDKFALMSLLRVARAERKHQRIYLLDIDNNEINTVAQALKYAPFHQAPEIACRNQIYWTSRLVHTSPVTDAIPPFWFATPGWHIVTGGMGGIGRIIIQWLAKSGARNIAVIGRRQPVDWDAFCLSMSALGCTVTTFLCDMSIKGKLEHILEHWKSNLPIIGAIHAAGTPANGLLTQWDNSQAERLIQTKSISFVNLHQWLESKDAQYLLGFSSVASLGAVGQGAYALANAYLDGYAFAQQGKSHCRVMTIDWGAWDNIGMTADQKLLDNLAKEGMHTFPLQEGLWHVSQSLLSGSPLVLAMNVESHHPNFSHYIEPSHRVNQINQHVEQIQPTAEHQVNDLSQWVSDRIRYQLGISDNEEISTTQDLRQLGLDSLQFLDISAIIQKQFGIKVNPEQVYDNLTVSGLAAYIDKLQPGSKFPPVVEPFVCDILNHNAPFPLTPIQHAYWIGREPWVQYGGIACNVVFEWDKNLEEFDPQKFEAAWNALIQRHDMLRMTVTASGEQIVQADVPYFSITETDLRSLPQEAQNTELAKIRYRMRHQVHPADKWPLFDVKISRLAEEKARLHMKLDLLQFDVQSFKIMMDDLGAAYKGKALSQLPITFRDYVMHEQKLRKTPEWQASWHYWQQIIPTLPKAPQLPQNPISQSNEPEFSTLEGRLKSSEWQTLKSRWQQWGVTPSAGLLMLFAYTLADRTLSPDFTLNMTFFNRQPFHEDVQYLIGDFTSVILMDFKHEQNISLKQRILETQDKLWQRLGHSQVNGVEVIRELAKHLKATGQMSEKEANVPLAPVVFTSMLGMSMDGMNIEQAMTHLLGNPIYVLSQTPQVWLDHQIMEVDGDLVFHWYYMEGVLEANLIDTLFNSYLSLLHQCATDPDLMECSVTRNHEQNNCHLSSPVEQKQSIDWQAIPMPEISPLTAQEVTRAWAHLEYRALCGIWTTLQHHQVFTSPEQSYSGAQIERKLKASGKHHKLIHLWLDQLCREGILKRKGKAFRYSGYFPESPVSVFPQQAWCQRLAQYVDDCILAHPALLNGSQSALELLFSDPTITDCLYRTNPSLQILNKSAAQAIKSIGETMSQSLRVLEVGAGTAATTREVLHLASSVIHQYQFTDVSQAFLHDAREILSEYPQVFYEIFDINKPINNKLKPENGYQVILAVNVLHDAIDLPDSLQRLRSLMAKDGYLILIEATDQYSSMQLATVGFIEGINAFSDFRQQAQSGMLTQPAWLSLLAEQGFKPQLTYPESDVSVLRQHLIIAKNSDEPKSNQNIQHTIAEEAAHPPSIISTSTHHQPVSYALFNKVAGQWSAILKQHVQANSDFFQSGGDSLMATRLIVELRQQGFSNATIQQIFEHPVLQDFVTHLNTSLSENQNSCTQSAPVKLTPESDKNTSTLFIVHPVSGNLLSYKDLASELNHVTLYGLTYPEPCHFSNIKSGIEALAQYHLSMIRKIQSNGPYQLAGWSFGGLVAFEIARQLCKQGEIISQCVLIDSYVPCQNPTYPLTETAIRQYFYADCVGRFPELRRHESPSFNSDDEFCSQLASAFSDTTSGSLDGASISHLLRVYQQNLRSLVGYTPPQQNSLPVTLYVAQSNCQPGFMSVQHTDISRRPCHGWSDYCSPAIHCIPGDHYTLLQQPNVKTLANALSTLLTKNTHSLDSYHKQYS